MKREDCWMTFSEALDPYMNSRELISHFQVRGQKLRNAHDDLQCAKDHLDALTSVQTIGERDDQL